MSIDFSEANLREALARKCPDPSPCPFCGFKSFAPYNKMTMLQVQSSGTGIQFGEAIPSAIVICSNCGYINLFALKPLGLNP